MSVIRTKRIQDFTVLPNALINDASLDGDALGLLVFLLSKPADWWVSINSLAGLKRFGSSGKVVSTLKRLRAEGYAKLIRMSTGHTEWIITDTRMNGHPATDPHSENDPDPHAENPHNDFPDKGNRNVLQRTNINKERIEEQRTEANIMGSALENEPATPKKPIKQPTNNAPPDWDDPVRVELWDKSMPFGFSMPDQWMVDVIAKHGCSQEAAQREADAFVEYWANGKGRKQKKLDWYKAWQVWCSKSYALSSTLPAAPRTASPKPGGYHLTFERMRAENARRAVEEFLHESSGVTIDA